MIELIPYLTAFSLIFAFIALCVSISNLMRWKKIEPDTMKARIFLDKSFIDNNFKLTLVIVIIVGGVLSLHSLMEYFEIIGVDFAGFYFLYHGMLPVATGILAIISFLWYKLLNMKFRQE